jgi:hypothetical protein
MVVCVVTAYDDSVQLTSAVEALKTSATKVQRNATFVYLAPNRNVQEFYCIFKTKVSRLQPY